MKHLHTLLIFLTLTAATALQGQIVGSNAFLKGVFVEVGINTCGAYGSNGAAPAGYHPNVWSGLGFVADGDMDGWAVAAPGMSNYCGDYFVPGAPVEGWQVQIGGTTYTNTDQSCLISEVPGSISSYDYTSGIYTAIWTGNIPAADVSITQTTTLPDSARYFVTRVLICNDGPTDLTNVYYKRNVDPDNEEPWTGVPGFTTTNTIVYNPPTDPDALVSAIGDAYGCYLGMGARDSNARASYGNFGTTDGTAASAWAGTSGYSITGTTYCDCATQMTFKIPLIAAGTCQCIAFAYILDADDLDEALEATTSIGVAADGVDISASGITLICPNDSVEINIIGGDGYDWTWDPPTGLASAVGDTVKASPAVTTTYTATGVGICGTIVREVTVEVPPAPIANAGPDMSLCPGDSIHLAGSGGVDYLWSPPVYLSALDTANPEVQNPLTDMFYQLVVFDANGCSDTDDVQVTLYDLPVVDAGIDQYMVKGGFAQLNASGAVTYTWTPPDFLSDPFISNPSAFPEDTTVYYVTGVDANGCENTDSMTLYVLDQTLVILPNAFTPNGDGLNDVWKPVLVGIGEITGFSIYNRWGDLIYVSNDPKIGWDGNLASVAQEVGNYVAVVHAIDGFGVDITKTSTVLLMR